MKSRGCLIAAGVGGGLVLLLLIVLLWARGVYNSIVTMDEGVQSMWSQVESQYQRRADLIPNLVNTVKGFASQEKEVLLGVTEARARVGQMNVTKDVINNPESFQKFQAAQDQLSSALSRLLVVAENYPQLKSNENFLALQSQLEGTENRIAVARKNFNEAVQQYNTTIRRFPENIMAGFGNFHEKEYFKAQAGSENAPEVKF